MGPALGHGPLHGRMDAELWLGPERGVACVVVGAASGGRGLFGVSFHIHATGGWVGGGVAGWLDPGTCPWPPSGPREQGLVVLVGT